MDCIVAHQLSKKFTSKDATTKGTLWALQDITFSVRKGELVGIIGANGAGKSTLLSLIAGVYEKDGGSLTVTGKVISIIGLAHGLQDRLTVRENIAMCCALYGLTLQETQKRLKGIAAFATLEHQLETMVYTLSTGMVARLIFSIAVHCDPDILILDEVTGHLDKEFIHMVNKAIRNFCDEGGTTVIVSHKREIIAACDRAIYIDTGVLRGIGASKEILTTYFHE